jgi:predicted amidohydrolase
LTDHKTNMNEFTVAAVQIRAVRGDFERNMERQLEFARHAAARGTKLIVFPELSLTGYELDLAETLAIEATDRRLEPLRAAAATYAMTIVTSAPWRAVSGRLCIGAFILCASDTRAYAKIHVHESENDYFSRGEVHCAIAVEGCTCGIAICADTSHPAHAGAFAREGVDLYAASVLMTDDDYRRHERNMARYATEHRMAAITANYAGTSGGYRSAGKSAFWNESGECLARAAPAGEALVIATRSGERWRADILTESELSA